MTNQAAQTMPGLHGLSDAADYLARNPSDEYAQRRFRERMEQVRAALSQTAGVALESKPFGHAMFNAKGACVGFRQNTGFGYNFTVADFLRADKIMPHGAPHTGCLVYAAAPAASGGDEPDPLVIAKELATSIWSAHYREDSPNWEPFDNLAYVLSQISNMVSGMTRIIEPPSAASVGGVHPDALQDDTLSKSTAKRVEALAARGKEDDSLTAAYMLGRYDGRKATAADLTQAQQNPNPPASASVSERARHIEVLHAIGSAFDGIPEPCEEREAIKAAVAAIEQALTQQRGEPLFYVLFEQQGRMVLFDGADETDGLYIWRRREDAQAAADRLHKSHGFPNDYWHVTPLYTTPQPQAAAGGVDALLVGDMLYRINSYCLTGGLSDADFRSNAEPILEDIRGYLSGAGYEIQPEQIGTTPQPSADAVREVIGSMRNFADVADKCELTEGNAQVAIRAWATQLESLLSGGSHA